MDRLVQAKLSMPRPRHLVSRPRLIGVLDGTLDARLTLVSAPPGFGKTSALADWLSARAVGAAWVSLDDADNDPVRFSDYLWAAASSLAAEGETVQAAQTADPAEVAGEVAAVLGERTEPSILVLDDYHVIDSGAVQEAVSSLIERLPEQAHLVIATRADPALPLARLRAAGELLEVRADALRFTHEEAAAFFAERMGLAMRESDLDLLLTRTEGWPAVLQLAGMSLAGRSDATRFVRDFAASHRHVLDYISDEVLAGLEPGDRDFLLRTSVLDRLSGPLCDALTGRTDGQATLERLERRNVLIVPLDDERSWYRYHRLFADLLRSRLAAEEPDAPALLHPRAAEWYERHGYLGDAIEHSLRGGDTEHAAALLERAAPDLIHSAQLATLRTWIERLPSEIVRARPFLATMYAWALVLSEATADLEKSLAAAESALPAALAAGDPAALTLQAQLAMIRSVAARQRGDVAGAIAYGEAGVALVPSGLPRERETLAMGDAQAILGHALLAAGDLDGAVAAYRAARPRVEAAGNLLGVADITRNLARVEARRGRLEAALDACDELLADARVDPNAPALAPVHLARAEILARRPSPGAMEAAERALWLARRGGDPVTAREARLLVERLRNRPIPAQTGALIEPLSERELEVLRLVAAGRSNGEIAAELYLAIGTVKAHVHAISGKLGAANRVEAAARARELRLV